MPIVHVRLNELPGDRNCDNAFATITRSLSDPLLNENEMIAHYLRTYKGSPHLVQWNCWENESYYERLTGTRFIKAVVVTSRKETHF